MNGPNRNVCSVLLPPDPNFTRLYDEILSLAISDVGMVPVRVQRDPSSPLPLDLLVRQIEQSAIVFADISEDHAEIWFGIGCTAALKKPLCLVSSSPAPFDALEIEQQPIIYYPRMAFPSDYLELRQSITNYLAAAGPQREATEYTPQTQSQPQGSLADDAYTLAPVAPSSADLVSYEVLALTIIDQKNSATGISPRALGLEMQASDSAHLTSHAINALKRRKFIERRPVQAPADPGPHLSENLFLTNTGEDWLIRNHKKAHRGPTNRVTFVTNP